MTLDVQGRSCEIIGIHDSSVRFASQGLFMPLDTVQDIFGLDGVNQITVRVATIEQVAAVSDAILVEWGDTVDVVAQKDSFLGRLEDSLSSLTSISRVGLVLALVTAGLVVFATMFLVVRERAREIGIMKAVGAGSRDIVLQFGTEAVALSLAAALVGLVAFSVFGPSAASAIVGAAEQTRTLGVPGAGQGPGLEGGGRVAQVLMARQGLGMLMGSVDVSVSWTIVGFAVAGGIALGLLGGLVPGLIASKLKPAEVIRSE